MRTSTFSHAHHPLLMCTSLTFGKKYVSNVAEPLQLCMYRTCTWSVRLRWTLDFKCGCSVGTKYIIFGLFLVGFRDFRVHILPTWPRGKTCNSFKSRSIWLLCCMNVHKWKLRRMTVSDFSKYALDWRKSWTISQQVLLMRDLRYHHGGTHVRLPAVHLISSNNWADKGTSTVYT